MRRTLPVVGGTLLSASAPTLLHLVAGPNPRVVVPFIVLTALISAAGVVATWWTWCHESPGTRAMAARYADLRELMDLAEDRDPLTGDGVVILTHHAYREVDGGAVREFVRIPTEAPRTVVEIDYPPALRVAELFLLHAHRPVEYRLRALVSFTHSVIRVERRKTRPRRHGLRDTMIKAFRRARNARAGVDVVTIEELDELITQVHRARASTL